MIIIGEKINGAIPSVAQAISVRDADYIKKLARIQTVSGATYIDVCASVDNSLENETLKWLIETAEEATDLPISIDSPNADVCVNAMKFCNKEGLINSVSGEGNKIDTVFPEITATNWNCIALLCDNSGIPKDAKSRLNVLDDIMKKVDKYSIKPDRLHIDPLVEMLCTADDGIKMILEVMREIKARSCKLHITGAISNISFNLPERKTVNQAFAAVSIANGMDSAILDPTNKNLMGIIYASEALMGDDELCINYINAYRRGIFGNYSK